MLPALCKTCWAAKRLSKCWCLCCRRKFGRGNVLVFHYRFDSNKHTHMFLLVTQAFWVFIVRMFFGVQSYVYFKSLNGNPACDCWTETSWQVMQRDSDQWRTQKMFMGVSFSGIWLSFVFDVLCLWRHSLTSYSCFQTNVLETFVEIICIFFYTHSPYFMCHWTEYKLSTLQVRISEENKLNATTQQFITA